MVWSMLCYVDGLKAQDNGTEHILSDNKPQMMWQQLVRSQDYLVFYEGTIALLRSLH